MTNLINVEGIGETYAQRLAEAGITTAQGLLENGATPKGRKEIADATGISSKLILEWVNHVDLFRVKGVGEEYADLLEEAGVDTIPELAQRNAENLYETMAAVNEAKKLIRRLPGREQVRDWIEQAKQLPRKISY